MNGMKIAMILRRLNVKGGTQRQALSLAIELKKRGHEVILHALRYSPENCYPDLLKNFSFKTLPENKAEAAGKLSRCPVFSKTGLADTISENREARRLASIMDDDFDLLNPHDQAAYKVAHYYRKLKKNVPSIWNMNDLPLRRWGYDRMRGCDDNFRQPVLKLLAYRLFDLYEKHAFLKRQDAIVVVDNFNRELVKKYLGLNAFTVRSGPDFKHFSYKEKRPPGRTFKILTSGILMPHRRFEDTISALPLLLAKGLDPYLTIIGDTDNDKKYYNRLRELADKLKLEDRVSFLGRVSEEKLVESYHDHHLYVFQHHLQSDGLSPFEAAASGCPLIVSKTAGCHEVLRDGETALFIEPKNPADIAEKISRLVIDPVLYSHLAENANRFIRANFSWEKYADGVLAVADKVMKEGRQMRLPAPAQCCGLM